MVLESGTNQTPPQIIIQSPGCFNSSGYAGSPIQKTFLINGPEDPCDGYAFCLSCISLAGRVVHFISGYGWLGHASCLLSPIPESEVVEFGLDASGFQGRRNKLAYSCLRARYGDDPELFCREILAPVLNQTLKSWKRKKHE